MAEASREDRKLGRIALQNKLVTREQLRECMRVIAAADDQPPLGLVLLRKGYLDDDQLQTLLEIGQRHIEEQSSQRRKVVEDIIFAQLVLQRQLVPMSALVEAAEAQRTAGEEGQSLRFGQLLVRRKLLRSRMFVELCAEMGEQVAFECPSCKAPFDNGQLDPGQTAVCGACEAPFDVPDLIGWLAVQARRRTARRKPRTERLKRARRRGETGRHRTQRRRSADAPATPPPGKSDEPDPRARKRRKAEPPRTKGEPRREEPPPVDAARMEFEPSDQALPVVQPDPPAPAAGPDAATRVAPTPEAPGGKPDVPRTQAPLPVANDTAMIRQALSDGLIPLGQYEIIEEIAQGGMGIVYKARQRGLNRIVALKVLKDQFEARSDQVLRFQREARAASRMNHPNVVSIIEVGESEGLHYMTMDYLEGTPLDELIEREGRIEPRQAADILAGVADAIHYAHSCNVVHRDLKPSNIIVDGEGRPHVTDFGLAKRIDSKSKLTETGALVGTPYYMAPEQIAEGSQRVSRSWDLYALGVILYEMLTGQLPFSGETTMEVYHQILNHTPKAPRQLVRAIPPGLERICLKTLAKDEAQRYRSVGRLQADLEAFLAGRQVSARPPGLLGIWLRRYERNTLLYTVIACAAVIVVGTVLILLIRSRRGPVEEGHRASPPRVVQEAGR